MRKHGFRDFGGICGAEFCGLPADDPIHQVRDVSAAVAGRRAAALDRKLDTAAALLREHHYVVVTPEQLDMMEAADTRWLYELLADFEETE